MIGAAPQYRAKLARRGRGESLCDATESVGAQPYGQPVGYFGRNQLPLLLLADAEIDRSFGKIGPQRNRATVGVCCRVEVALVLSDETHRKPGLAAVRREGHYLLKCCSGVLGIADPAQTQTEL